MRRMTRLLYFLPGIFFVFLVACGGGSASTGNAQQLPTELIGSWQLVSSTRPANSDQVIHFHRDGSLTVETVAIDWNTEESGEYSRAPHGGVRIQVFNEFGFAYVDNEYAVMIVGDNLRLATLDEPANIQKWIRVK